MENLIDEIKTSEIFKLYKFLTLISVHIKAYKKAMILLFIIGFVDHVFGGNAPLINWAVFIGIIPGILFAFVAGVTHLLAGIRIRGLCSKYSIDETRMKEIIDENC